MGPGQAPDTRGYTRAHAYTFHVRWVKWRMENFMRTVVLEDKQPRQLRTQDQEGAAVEARKVGKFAVHSVTHIVHRDELHAMLKLFAIFLWRHLLPLAGVVFVIQDLCPPADALAIDLHRVRAGYCISLLEPVTDKARWGIWDGGR